MTDQRPEVGPRAERFLFPGGAKDFVAFLAARAGASDAPRVLGFEREDPRIGGSIEVALAWSLTAPGGIHSFANGRPTPGGGTHVVGFRHGLAAALDTFARERRLSTASGTAIGPGRFRDGLTAVVSVKLDHPEFEGATRGMLGNAGVREAVSSAVREHVSTWLRADPGLAATAVGRITAAG
ncbi:hypothetical protein [Streptomyces sp. NPDC015131]|uniref:hypothetical protein n=1 Tax=Streptomyces sp. NPDC015131 TaxID=3364941 RepID=UPI0036F7DA7B